MKRKPESFSSPPLLYFVTAFHNPTEEGIDPHLCQASCLLYVEACDRSSPLGMISGEIKDWQISSSSTRPSYDLDYRPRRSSSSSCHEQHARVYQPNGLAWCAKYKTSSEWLQIDLGVVAKVLNFIGLCLYEYESEPIQMPLRNKRFLLADC